MSGGKTEFPYSSREWNQVRRAATAVCNASLADDRVMRASCFARLRRVLKRLRARHGEHAVLLETEADFTEDVSKRHALYKHALFVAQRDQLPTFSIRISFAESMLHDGGEVAQVNEQLIACKGEVEKLGDAHDKKRWLVLMDKASRAKDCDA